ALVYLIAPYHLYFDLYVYGAYAEFTAYIWFPLIFAGMDSIRERGSGRPIVLTALAYGLLVMTHLPTALLLTPFLALYGLALSFTGAGANSRLLVRQAGALFLGLGLASVYLVPALGLLDA